MVSDQHKAMIRAASVLAAVVWAVLGLFGGWPHWLWSLLALFSLVGPSLVVHGVHEWNLHRAGSRSAPQPPEPMPPEPMDVAQYAPPAPPPLPDYAEYAVSGVPFGSAESDCRVYLSCVVRWRPVQSGISLEHQRPGAWAAEFLFGEAAPVLEQTLPEDRARAEHRLADLLGSRRTDPTGRMEFHAKHVSVVLADADKSWIDARKESRREAQLWYQSRDFERAVRSYLEQEVLDSPGSTLVWWLAQPRTDEKDRVDDAVGKIEQLRELAGAAAVRELPSPAVFRMAKEGQQAQRGEADSDHFVSEPEMFDPFRQPVGNGDAEFVLPEQPASGAAEDEPEAGPREHALGLLEAQEEGPERDLFAARLAKALQEQGDGDLAAEIRQRFDRPSPVPSAAEPDDPQDHGESGQSCEDDEEAATEHSTEAFGTDAASEPPTAGDAADPVMDSEEESDHAGDARRAAAAADALAAAEATDASDSGELPSERPTDIPQWSDNGRPKQ